MSESKSWVEKRRYSPEYLRLAEEILADVQNGVAVMDSVRRHPPAGGGHIAKHVLVHVYHQLVDEGKIPEDESLLTSIRMKPVRTLSGVTTVTILTKPYPCPGNCIFCPTEDCEPKSYLSDEPGARRALQNHFDPFLQISTRLQALQAVGHPTDKIELLILGGTFTAYPRRYQQWFVEECYRALNQEHIPLEIGVDFNLEDLEKLIPADPPPDYRPEPHRLRVLHQENENSPHRNVGLVLETRPDEITYEELAWLRSLGATKLQMGAQSLDDRILKLNRRGHTVQATFRAVARARAAGFKVVLHWMPNLLGATLQSDLEDFSRLWGDANGNGGLCPDEIKIYPTQLLESAELYQYWQRGEYHPYTEQDLIYLLADVKALIPTYCRVNRVIRDIPSTNVVAGNRRTSLRQDALLEMSRRGTQCRCIRCREVRDEKFDSKLLVLKDEPYRPAVIDREASSEEHFISFVTPDDKIAGYLRLSLPLSIDDTRNDALPDLAGCALIREIHVYGQALGIGSEKEGAAQHIGLGTKLIEEAVSLSGDRGFSKLAVISAIGTRNYYRSRGFTDGTIYQIRPI
jgi:elongator complex protein 3